MEDQLPKYQIQCRDCGGPYEAGRRDAQTCPSCRLLRVVGYAAGKWRRPRECGVCGGKFRPVTSKDLRLCGHCRPQPGRSTNCVLHELVGQEYRTGEGPLLAIHVPVCLHCATDPDKQVTLLRSLKGGQAARRAQYMTPANPEDYQ